MIRIRLNSKRFLLTVEGHAQPEESEEYREICAGASMLVQGLVYSVSKLNRDNDALVNLKYRDEPGNMMLKVIPEEWAETLVLRRFNLYGDGLEFLTQQHPECMSMVWDGEKIMPDKEAET